MVKFLYEYEDNEKDKFKKAEDESVYRYINRLENSFVLSSGDIMTDTWKLEI